MSEDGSSVNPWWYSGDDAEPADGTGESPEDRPEAGEGEETTVDWGELLSGAFRMVDWATSAVMAPHSEHADPAEHPQCIVCRGILLVSSQAPGAAGRSPSESAPRRSSEIRWIPIADDDRTV